MRFKSIVLLAVLVLLVFAGAVGLSAQEFTPTSGLLEDGSAGSARYQEIDGARTPEVADQNPGSCAVVDSEEDILITEYDVPVSPLNLLLNPAGEVWFSSFADNALGKLDPNTREITVYSRQDDGGSVWAAEQGPTGGIWYGTVNASDDVVGKFDPAANTFVEWAAPEIEAVFGLDIDPASGEVWFASRAGGICRLSPTTNSLEVWTMSSYTSVYDIDMASDGSVWFTVQPQGNQGVGNLNPTTGAVNVWEMPQEDSRPFRIVATASDEIWFTETATSTNSIARLVPSTSILSEFEIPVADSFPGGLVKDAAEIWFTAGGVNSIGRLQPSVGSPTTHNLSPLTLHPAKTVVSITPRSYAATIERTVADVLIRSVPTSSSGAYTLLSLPASDSAPFGIATGSKPDEAWFTATRANYIGKLTAGVAFTESVFLPLVLR